MVKRGLLAGVVACWVGLAAQADVAVLIGNTAYDGLPNVRDARFATSVKNPLEEAGFDVLSLRNGSPAEMANLMMDAAGRLGGEDRLIIFLAGQFAADSGESYLLGEASRRVTRFNVGQRGLALAPVLKMLSEQQGRALLLLGQDVPVQVLQDAEVEAPTAPNGVAIVSGPTETLARLLARDLLGSPGASVREAFDQNGVAAQGYLPEGIAFLENGRDLPEDSRSEELIYWDVVQDLDTAEAYQAYVDRFPSGIYVAEANAALNRLRGNAENAAEAAEQALALNRNARREIQRNLALLEFDPRGIDGIFGRGTRAAIRAWQGSRGFEQSGFLSANQLSALSAQASLRAAELEAEAEARRAEELRRDRAFWVSLGTNPSPDQLRDYLRNFPDGQFSEIARSELDQIEAEARAEAEAQDRAAWDRAVSRNTVAAYRRYLEEHPDGVFADAARERIRAAREDRASEARIAQDRSQEAQITQLQITRVLIEQRLRQKGQNPGTVDGQFTQETRRAIRRFQRTRNLPVTGFVGQDTAVALLSG
ncbi:peptidoglycan-binding protein [Shimia ponticola]|uniref:peptidoglycan-binding protein n=1 Tax=Shimia ponticola TaxID=2582893 RepID=UPI00164A14F0|nr:peptidoglycan-binding protein [Shimia ponticola]